jgi:hypothetical protein
MIMSKTENYPNGGFPPIYICRKESKNEDDNPSTSKREYTAPQSTVSIKSILEKRRVVPFIKI